MEKKIEEVKGLRYLFALFKSKVENESRSKYSRTFFFVAFIVSAVFLSVSIYFFIHNHTVGKDTKWIVNHDVWGTFGDFIGGVLGTCVALYSAYLLVMTLRYQIDVNDGIDKMNKKTYYQTDLQLFDNRFRTLLESYHTSVATYTHSEKQIVNAFENPNKIGAEWIKKEENSCLHGRDALERIASKFVRSKFTYRSCYKHKVNRAVGMFDDLYVTHRREMSVHFRTLYLLAKSVCEMECGEESTNSTSLVDDRKAYAKCLRGQLSEGELLLLRYNCLSARGEMMRNYVNQLNLIKHIPIMSLLEFTRYREIMTNEKYVNTLDDHFFALKRKLKHMILGFLPKSDSFELSKRYLLEIKVACDNISICLTLKRMKKKPATGSVGAPPIDKALNLISDANILEMYSDFLREYLEVSNFYVYNSGDPVIYDVSQNSDSVWDYFYVYALKSSYPIIICREQLETPIIAESN